MESLLLTLIPCLCEGVVMPPTKKWARGEKNGQIFHEEAYYWLLAIAVLFFWGHFLWGAVVVRHV